MVGKAGVWAHFGSWDFRRAKMWQTVRGKKYDNGTKILKEMFNLTPEMADRYYYEIQGTDADRWISAWPSFRSGLDGCSKDGEIVRCGNGAIVNLTAYDAVFQTQQGIKHPESLVYATKKDLVEKKYEEDTVPFSLVLVPDGDNYKSLIVDPPLAKSIFVRLFFFNGLGSKHYKVLSDKTTLTGQRVIVWVVDFEEHEPITMEKEIAGNDDSVDVVYIGWLENGTVFDSSIKGWEDKNISKETELTEDLEYRSLSFKLGSGSVVAGFEEAVLGMKLNEVKVVTIPPEKAYGLDPNLHLLGNKTLNFKIKLMKIE